MTEMQVEQRGIVYVIDDDEAVRGSIERLIRSVGLDARVFDSTDAFLKHGDLARPTCLVLDVRMPGRSGLELQADLVRSHFAVPIIFISGVPDVQMSVRAMKAGAVEFITKPVRPQELLDAIQSAIKLDTATCDQADALASLRQRRSMLSGREEEVLRLVVSGLLNKQVASELGITEATVKLHRANVMRKMNAKSIVDLVRMVDKLAMS